MKRLSARRCPFTSICAILPAFGVFNFVQDDMRVFRGYITTSLLLLTAFALQAQVSFVTKTSATKIAKDELLEVNYEAQNGVIQDFTRPSFAEWEIVAGPSVTSSTFISNGAKTTSMSYQFILQPKRAGLFKVPGASAVVDGRTVTSNAVSVTVSNKMIGASKAPPSGSLLDPLLMMPPPPPEHDYGYDGFILRSDEDIREKTSNNLFIAVDVTKKTCYPGEAIQAVYKLYSRVNVDAHITRRPSFSGFSSIDLPDSSNREYYFETLNGKQFKVYIIRNVQLYPLLTGDQTLEPVEIEANVQYKKLSPPTPGSLFDQFDEPSLVNFPYTVKSEPVTIKVLPFPEAGKPRNFTGVTGNFKVSAAFSDKELALNEAGKLSVRISGEGNWAMLQPPVIKWPDGVDVYEPEISESLDSQAVPVNGYRVYTYPFTTQQPGTLSLPPVEFAFFNATSGRYETSSSDGGLGINILNIQKPKQVYPNSYNGISGADNTQIFTDIVKIAFPVLALLLLLWLAARSNRYKSLQTHQASSPSHRSRAVHEPERAVEHYAPPPVEPVEKEHGYRDAPTESNNAKEHLSIEKETLVNEHAGYAVTNTKTYFTGIKKDVLRLLEKHLQLSAAPVIITKEILLEKGMDEENAEKILQLLEMCERHIYSPLTTDFDQADCDQLVSEIHTVVRTRS